MKQKNLLLVCIALLLIAVLPFVIRSRAQGQKPKPVFEPPHSIEPPQSLIDRLGVPRVYNGPAPTPDPTEKKRTKADDIYKAGDYPAEWDSWTDEQVQREMYKYFSRDPIPPADWDPTKKFYLAPKGREAGDGRDNWWRVFFTFKVRKVNFDATCDRILSQYGVQEAEVKRYQDVHLRGFWIKADEVKAKWISEDSEVRAIHQNQRIGPILTFDGPSTPATQKDIDPIRKNQERIRKSQRLRALPRSTSFLMPYFGARFNVDYNLDRLDNRNQTADGVYYSHNDGANSVRAVDLYIVDTDRVKPNTQLASYRVSTLYDLNPSGTNHHGTLCAVVAAGYSMGVSNAVNIVSVALGNSVQTPDLETVFVGMRDNINFKKSVGSGTPAVVSMSIAVLNAPSQWDPLLSAIIDAADTPIIVSAGQNFFSGGNENAANYWPQRHPKVYNIGYMDNYDDMVGGYCSSQFIVRQYTGIDNFAWAGPKLADHINCPVQVTANGILSMDGSSTPLIVFGSSFAAPQVAALYAQVYSLNGYFYPRQEGVYKTVNNQAGVGVQYNYNFAANRTAYNGWYGWSVSRNAASFFEGTAPGSVIASFGQFYATPDHAYLEPDDGVGSTYQLTFLSANNAQSNWYVPTNVPVNTYLLKQYASAGQFVGLGPQRVNDISPGIYYSTSGGNNWANGFILRVNKSSGAQTFDAITSSGNSWNPATEDAYLILYGTGSVSTGSHTYTLKIDNVNQVLSYVGPQELIRG